MSVREQIAKHEAAFQVLRPFVSKGQFQVMIEHSVQSEEKQFFLDKLHEYTERVANMPESYQQDGKGDHAVAYLHYFHGGSDWYITEKDMEGGVTQAFGYAVLNGDEQNAEVGYISIEELVGLGVELDLHFEPRTLLEVKKQRASHGHATRDTEEQDEVSRGMSR